MTMDSGPATVRAALRADAGKHMRLVLVSFAASVLGTRLFLALTGYPRIGGGTLHISHALWGGLLLFVASLLPLVLDGRGARTWAALCSGVGVGLFIDEVGKLITRDYDYFFPAAAPIVYAVFLLAVLVYAQARRSRDRNDPRAELRRALEEIEDALDRNLRPREHAKLEARLRRVTDRAGRPDLGRLAGSLRDLLLRSDALRPASSAPNFLTRSRDRLGRLAARLLTERRLRLGLVAGLGLLGALAAGYLVVMAGIALDWADGRLSGVWERANRFARIEVDSARDLLLLLARATLDVLACALLLAAAALLLWRRRARRALGLAHHGLLLSLVVVTPLVFYFEQFLAAGGAIAQFALLRGVVRYRGRYLDEPS